ncbi:Hypothetical predicted protein [Paramuricea clavata]|uniref:Uncharacterized protein n=1 Tax=Paramuricea clavata TaxID=317549 RepID=A0A7D9HTE0_PARCT|nr:Hypothetical predicted protein [Paramuricea clavata]
MYRFCFVLTLCVYGVLGMLEDFDDWQYDTGRPSTNNQGGDSKCKKDLLLIVDTSYSVGENDFNANVKPFLKNLVTASSLNVGPDGTQIGLMLFASKDKTGVKLNIGQKKDARELGKYMTNLNWNTVKGDRTRTELALEKALQIFSKDSPKNHRQEIADVVVLITDGKPQGKSNSIALTKQYAKDLKDKGVLLVTAGVGPNSKKTEFKNLLKKLATSPDYFLQAEFDNMKAILNTLVARSCTKPGECICKSEIISSPIFVRPGQSKAVARWPNPEFDCATGGEVVVESTKVQPSVSSPHAFSPGKHVINYTYNLKGGISVKCPVTITVIGQLCRGKAFNSVTQVCCCGTIHPRRTGFACCGPDYYNTSSKQCCSNANLVSRTERCPGN